MKLFFVLLLVCIALWLIATARNNRHNKNSDSSGTGSPDVTGEDYSLSHCNSDSNTCDGGSDGGGGGD